jgi:methylated-DNA-protein-cysteine methyltransferase-like protein
VSRSDPLRPRFRSLLPGPRPRARPLSPTYARLYAIVGAIPRGRVATYGQIATLAGLPHAPRVAGYALHALPEGSPIPWHRVVAAGGRLSLARLDPDSALTQRLRLEKEGVRFDARGRVDLERSGWKPRARPRSPKEQGRKVRFPRSRP